MKTVLLVVTIFLLMSSVGVYASTIGETGQLPVDSPSSEPLNIGWTLNGGKADGVSVTWTPVAAAVYIIQATAGGVTGAITTPITSTDRRTDLVPIVGVRPGDVESVSVAIVEN